MCGELTILNLSDNYAVEYEQIAKMSLWIKCLAISFKDFDYCNWVIFFQCRLILHCCCFKHLLVTKQKVAIHKHNRF